MTRGEPIALMVWFVLPLICAGCAAVAAVLHYGTALRKSAGDLPNLPMAIFGGATAGLLSALTALLASHFIELPSFHPFAIGILFAALSGEYFGGRCDSALSAIKAGVISTLVLFPFGALLMSALR